MSISAVEPCTKCGGLGPKRKQRKTCIQCSVARVREWKQNNPERYAIARKAGRLRWKKKNLEKPTAAEKKRAYDRQYNFKRKYGMTVDDYDSMLSRQNGACAICSGRPNSKYGTFHVDHCHTTGLVRGLLCSPCNTALGSFKDNPALLQRAIHYLKGEL